jgi:PAS domain-containing protein
MPDEAVPFFLSGDSSMALQVRSFDWEASPLGQPSSWSPTLKAMAQLLLASKQPMFLVWGSDRTWLYNDAMIAIMGRKHPAALGRPIQEVWSEAWSLLEPLVKRAFDGEPIHQTGFLLPVDRYGSIEDAYFNFSYTPMPMPGGQVEGLFGVCTETTGTVTASRD